MGKFGKFNGLIHSRMWGAGLFAALSQMIYPAISAFVSLQTDKQLQGTVQGILSGQLFCFSGSSDDSKIFSGIRGLCQGMGPAFFGLVFYLFDMDLNSDEEPAGHIGVGPQFPVPNIRLQPFENKIISPSKNSTLERIAAIGTAV
jgi:hypothetical protein